MNWAHVHLMLNHIPVLGATFGLALLAWALLRRNEALERVALGTFAVVALAAIPVYLTGGPAEGVVERLAGTAEPAIEAHEAAALVAVIAIGALGVFALTTLWLFRNRALPRPLAGAALVFALATAGWMAQTANLGGRIRHAELRAQEGTPPQQDHDTTDDDRRGLEGR